MVAADLEKLEIHIKKAQQQIQRLVDGYQGGYVRPEEMSNRRAAIEKDIDHLIWRRSQLKTQKPRWHDTRAASENLSLFCEHVSSALGQIGFEEKSILLRKIIERISVTARNVKIESNSPSDCQRNQT